MLDRLLIAGFIIAAVVAVSSSFGVAFTHVIDRIEWSLQR